MREGNMKKSSMEMSTGEQEGGESLLKRGEKVLPIGPLLDSCWQSKTTVSSQAPNIIPNSYLTPLGEEG